MDNIEYFIRYRLGQRVFDDDLNGYHKQKHIRFKQKDGIFYDSQYGKYKMLSLFKDVLNLQDGGLASYSVQFDYGMCDIYFNTSCRKFLISYHRIGTIGTIDIMKRILKEVPNDIIEPVVSKYKRMYKIYLLEQFTNNET